MNCLISSLISVFLLSNVLTYGQRETDLAFTRCDLKLAISVVDNSQNTRNPEVLMDQLEAHYILLFCTLSYDDEDTFDQYVDEAVDIAERLTKIEGYQSSANAMLAAIYGLKIAYSPMMGMFFGPKAKKYADAAIKSDANNPDALMMAGVNFYNTPKTFGGDTDLAIDLLQQAIHTYEKNNRATHNWKYLYALCWLGIAYEEQQDMQLAKSAYTKSVMTESTFKWGKELLSQLPK